MKKTGKRRFNAEIHISFLVIHPFLWPYGWNQLSQHAAHVNQPAGWFGKSRCLTKYVRMWASW